MSTFHPISSEGKLNLSSHFFYLSKFWRKWKKSEFYLDLEFNILKFRKKRKNFVAQLHEYDIEFINDYKGFYCLQLVSKGKKKTRIFIGSKDKGALLEWYTRIISRVKFFIQESVAEAKMEEESFYDEGLHNEPIANPQIVMRNGFLNEDILRLVPKSHKTLAIKAAQYINKLRLGYQGLWTEEDQHSLYSSERTFCFLQKNKQFVSTFISSHHPNTLFNFLNERHKQPSYDENLEKVTSRPLEEGEEFQNGKETVSNQSQLISESFSTHSSFKFEFHQFALKLNEAFLILKLGTDQNTYFRELSQIFIIYPLQSNKCSLLLTEYTIIPKAQMNFELIKNEVLRQVKSFEKIDSKIVPGEFDFLFPNSNQDNISLDFQLLNLSTGGTTRKTSERRNNFDDFIDELQFENYLGPFDSSYPGNGEILMTPERILVVMKMIRDGEHVKEAITRRHATRVSNGKNIRLESNEVNGHYIFRKDYQNLPKGGLLYVNHYIISEQKRIITWVLKRLSSSIFSGKGLMSISLPVTIFEPRSFLERFARSLGFAPDFLERAGTCTDPVERLKLVLSFFCGAIIICLNAEKPFNPLLGETFQGRINGNLVYLEQISHHPPISNYLLVGKNYRLYGNHLPLVNLSPNSFVVELEGTPTIEFLLDKTKIKLKWPKFTMTGLSFGTRIMNFFSKAIAYDYKNHLYAEINYNTEHSGFFSAFSNKRVDVIMGGIYKVDPLALLRLESEKKHFNFQLKQEEIRQKVSHISGLWDQYLEFDGQRYWSVEQNRPFLLEYELSPLPSDCTFREDVLVMRTGDIKEAQNKKEQTEDFQRADKKLRDNFHKK